MRKLLPAFITASLIFALGCSTGTPMTNRSQTHNSGPAAMSPHDSHAGHSMESSTAAADAEFDLQFLDTMTAHHQGAVDMAQVALAKKGRPELQQLARTIIADQQKEIAEMKQLRDAWYPGKPAAVNMHMPGMHDSMSGMDMTKLGSLDGKEFDIEFIRQMSPHHAGALVMAKDARQRSQRPEIKTFANRVIEAQEKEIKQMADWQAAWNR